MPFLVPSGMTGSTPQTFFSSPFVRMASFFAAPKRVAVNERVQTLEDLEPIVQPHPIPKLSIFDEVAKRLSSLEISNLDKTIAVYRQHNLVTTANVYAFGKKLGMDIYGVGKLYSSNPSVAKTISNLGVHLMHDVYPQSPGHYAEASTESLERLWREVERDIERRKGIRNIVILDDGGGLFETMPKHLPILYPMAGVEQTRGGLYSRELNNASFPVIDVASSAAKREIEPLFIAKTVVDKVAAYIPALTNKKTVFGIIGNGAIGFALAKYLISVGYNVMAYDANSKAFPNMKQKGFYRASSAEFVISNANCIFGCTGQDITADIDLSWFATGKIFISCTSEDREFRTALRKIPISKDYNPLDNVSFVNPRGAKMTFVYGGFPINFAPLPKVDDETGKPVIPAHGDLECVPGADIEMTRSLLILGLTQAMLSAKKVQDGGVAINEPSKQCLDPFGQRAIVTSWLKARGKGRFSAETFRKFQDIDWIIKNSGGTYQPNKQLEKCFENFPRYDEPIGVEKTQEAHATPVMKMM